MLFAGSAHGQEAVVAKSGQSAATPGDPRHIAGLNLRVETTLVLIPVAVTDSLNRLVLGLQKEDFHLSEDGVEQNVAHFSGEDAPLSVGLVFDESGSMDYKLRTSQAAVAEFLKTMNANDDAFLVEFSDHARLSVGFTADTDEIQHALKKAQPSGLTAMLDAINLALHEMKKARNSRKAIVIISDGGDNHSHYTAADIEVLVREADVQIYAMGVFEPSLPFGLTPRKSQALGCYRRLRRKPVGVLSQQRSWATCRASPPELGSNCGINMFSAITRRIRLMMENTVTWK
jgi:VWFA-related protein